MKCQANDNFAYLRLWCVKYSLMMFLKNNPENSDRHRNLKTLLQDLHAQDWHAGIVHI